MLKSKRNKIITLSKTKKKGREQKEVIVTSIRGTAEKYCSVFVFSFENTRNLAFNEFREQLKATRKFFLGSNKVMQVALGRSAADEIRPGLYKVSKDNRLKLSLVEDIKHGSRVVNQYCCLKSTRNATQGTLDKATWCGPCRMIHPVIEELAKQYAGKLKCYRVNTNDCPGVASEYGIRSIPTVIIFKNGEKKDSVIGTVPKSTLTSSIKKLL